MASLRTIFGLCVQASKWQEEEERQREREEHDDTLQELSHRCAKLTQQHVSTH